MEHKDTAIKKSVVLSKFNTTKLHDTGDFCADVINFRDELNRWSAEAEAMGIKIDGEMIKTQFKLGLPSSHQHKSIRDIFRRYDDQDWNIFQARVINDLQEDDILNEVQESLIPTSKIQSRTVEMQKESSDPLLLKANIADLQRQLALYNKLDSKQSIRTKFKAKRFESDHKSKNSRGDHATKPKFTGTCHVCGKVGHKAADCWNKKSNQGNNKENQDKRKRNSGECTICHKVGHSAESCWHRDKKKPRLDTDTDKFKGKVFITFKDRSTAEYKPVNGGLSEDDSESDDE
jgi:hypothetical protein